MAEVADASPPPPTGGSGGDRKRRHASPVLPPPPPPPGHHKRHRREEGGGVGGGFDRRRLGPLGGGGHEQDDRRYGNGHGGVGGRVGDGRYMNRAPDWSDSGRGGWNEGSGNSRREVLMSYKQFIQELEDDVSPVEAQSRFMNLRSNAQFGQETDNQTGTTAATTAFSHTPSAMSQRPEVGSKAEGNEEQRLRAALRHLQAEAGVLERLVYKHRNQHRGAAYFQYLLKVRRDLKLLLDAGLAEVLTSVIPVLACRKPANTILVATKQTKKKSGANHSHHERLLGVARLLSQMAEPVMKAAVQITFLLARSFFIDLCTTVFSLLARTRVLVQQMLLDVVSIYNKVTYLTDRKQAVKISIGRVQAFREYYPSMNDACTILECVWVKDKFVLHEKIKDSRQEVQAEDQKSCGPKSSIQYETLALFSEDTPNLETHLPAKAADTIVAGQPDKMNHCSDAGCSQE